MIATQTLAWREPLWLLLCLYPLAMLCFSYAIRCFCRDHYADAQLLPWVIAHQTRRQRLMALRHLLTLLAWSCFAIAMAGPRLAEKIYQTDHDNYAEIMIVLDLSQSMAAKDLLPNRLQRARLELVDFLQKTEQQRIGLTVFAARPHLLSPMTYDRSVIQHYLAALAPALLPTAGSNINDALVFASQQFPVKQNSSRAIILLSDGNSADDLSSQALTNTARQLKQMGIRVYSLGIGSLTGEVVVTQLEPRYQQTQSSLSTLQRESLQQIALLTNGAYSDVTDDNSDWQRLYDQGLKQLTLNETRQQRQNSKILWQELYHLPLILAFVFFLLSLSTSVKNIHKAQISSSLAVLLCLFLNNPQALHAAEISYAQGYQYFQSGHYKKAQQLFTRLPGFAARLGEANALYQQGDYQQARNVYIQASLAATSDLQRATALFNLANTYYQLKQFVQAQQLYQDVLIYQPQHSAAQTNIDHAQRQQRLLEAENALTYRAGRGPRTGTATADLDLSNTQISLGDSSNDDVVSLPDPATNNSDRTRIFETATLASQQEETVSDEDWSYQLDTTAALQLHQQSLRTDNTYVWRRLFEQEEGFPAPVSVPHPVPGVSPW